MSSKRIPPQPPAPECALVRYWNVVQAFRSALPGGLGLDGEPLPSGPDAGRECLDRLADLHLLRTPSVGRAYELGVSIIEAGRVLAEVESACRDLLEAARRGQGDFAARDRLSDALVPLLDILDHAAPTGAPFERPSAGPAVDQSWLSAKDIASRFNVPSAALRARLDRFRNDSDVGHREIERTATRQPKYFYLVSSITHIIIDLQRARSAH